VVRGSTCRLALRDPPSDVCAVLVVLLLLRPASLLLPCGCSTVAFIGRCHVPCCSCGRLRRGTSGTPARLKGDLRVSTQALNWVHL
jgi:hypothetical protein